MLYVIICYCYSLTVTIHPNYGHLIFTSISLAAYCRVTLTRDTVGITNYRYSRLSTGCIP